ncbi:NAD-dependent epimerase/dehydratase family protein [Brevibacillus fulvus]|uniref:UDP-glucose 4-epimerase n=1 Tax=Brevibacillus fulvus TaxID=1125967 RepID=A0A939BU13_9BACL|nr:NAD-dependent epimerase/dehydratase family protein [Brevibacillus fulvus]MBM7589036.1 UDP-glucose 4-epimerase [Brevibacillus fulvus]
MNYGNVLVTGGAGFVGSQLVKRLQPIAGKIYVIDDLSTGQAEAIPQADNIVFYHDSLLNEALLEEILPQVEWIFHLACRNLVLSATDLFADFQVNLAGGLLLLEKARTCGGKLKKMIYTSTASVYGNAPLLPTPETWHQTTMPYAASKFSMEHYCQVYYHMYQLPVTTLRLSNVYGPGQLSSNPYCGVVAKFFEAIWQDQPLIIYGDGQQTRDFTYIDDAIDALLTVSGESRTTGEVYNVGTGVETSVNQLAKAVLRITQNEQRAILYQPKRTVDRISRRVLDSSKLQNETNWRVRISLEDGLRKTYQWLREGGKQG